MSRRRAAAAAAGIAALLGVGVGAGVVDAFANSLTVTSGHLDAKVTPTSLTTTTSTTAGGVLTFSVSAPSPVTAGSPFNVTVQALIGGLPDNTFIGQKCVTFSGPGNAPNGTVPTYPAQGACAAGQSEVVFTLGSATVPVTLFRSESVTITATSGTRTGTSGTVAVDSKGVALNFGTCPKTHPKNTTVTYTLSVPNDAYGNPFTSAAGLSVNLSFSGGQATNYKFQPSNTSTRTLTVTTGPAGNTFGVSVQGNNQDTTLVGTTTATGFTNPPSCALDGTS